MTEQKREIKTLFWLRYCDISFSRSLLDTIIIYY